MNKIALITDSTCDLNKETIEKYNIKVLPLRIIYKDREFIDRVNITPEEVYNSLSNEIPSTSLPSMQDIDTVFSSLESEGYTHAIVLTISSGLSGTFNSIKLISQNYSDITTFVYDSLSISMGLGALVEECGVLIEKGVSFEEIVNSLPSMKSRISIHFVVETLEYLKKGGRIGKISATIGELLNIKPIISIDYEGKYYTYTKVRGRKQSITKLIELSKDILSQGKAKLYILHGGALEEGTKICESFKNTPNITTISLGNISPAMGVHTGPGLLGITLFKES